MSATERLGTLMWIGARDGEFAEAYQYCLDNAAQLALREHCEQALDRRATGVRGIVVARNNRAPISTQSLSRLKRRYSAAEFVQLLGSLSLGMRSGEDLPASERMALDRWSEVLPSWLTRWGAAQQVSCQPCHSVVVVASHYQAALPLIEMAASAGATTAWVRSPVCLATRNFDAVWWDDSIASPTTLDGWRDRLQHFQGAAGQTEHLWIAGNVTRDQTRVAHQAGVQRILAKPYRIDGLLETLANKSAPPQLRAA